MNKPYEPTAKTLIETLLNKLDPKAPIVVQREFADELGQGGIELQIFDMAYKDGKFVIRVVEWL